MEEYLHFYPPTWSWIELSWSSITSLTMHLKCVTFCYSDILSLGILLFFCILLHTTATIFSCVPTKFCKGGGWDWLLWGASRVGWGWRTPQWHLYTNGPSWRKMPLWQVPWCSYDFSTAKGCLQPQRNGCKQHVPTSLAWDTSPSSHPENTLVAKPTYLKS